MARFDIPTAEAIVGEQLKEGIKVITRKKHFAASYDAESQAAGEVYQSPHIAHFNRRRGGYETGARSLPKEVIDYDEFICDDHPDYHDDCLLNLKEHRGKSCDALADGWKDAGALALGELQQASVVNPFFVTATGVFHSGRVDYRIGQTFINAALQDEYGPEYFSNPDDGYKRSLDFFEKAFFLDDAWNIVGEGTRGDPLPSDASRRIIWTQSKGQRANLLHQASQIHLKHCGGGSKCAVDPEKTDEWMAELMMVSGVGPKVANLMMEYLGESSAVALDRHTVNFLCNNNPSTPLCYQINERASNYRDKRLAERGFAPRCNPRKEISKEQWAEWYPNGCIDDGRDLTAPNEAAPLTPVCKHNEPPFHKTGQSIWLPCDDGDSPEAGNLTDILLKDLKGHKRKSSDPQGVAFWGGLNFDSFPTVADGNIPYFQQLKEDFGSKEAKPCGMSPAIYQVAAWMKVACGTGGATGVARSTLPLTNLSSITCGPDGITIQDIVG